MRSLITVQLGGYANYVGAHFWNMQDEAAGLAEAHGGAASPFAELDADVLYRSGGTAKAPTYAPRLLLLDLSGALGGVACGGEGAFAAAGGDAPPVVATWGGATHLVRREAVPKSGFVRALEAEAAEAAEHHDGEAASGSDDEVDAPRGEARRRHDAGEAGSAAREADGAADDGDEEGSTAVERAGAALESSVSYWSDYAKALLHPRSTLLLPGVWHGVHACDGYGDSRDFVGGDTGEAARDSLRYFAEECDTLGGFQLLAHDAGGFGALTEGLLAHLRDEYARTPVMLFSTRPPLPSNDAAALRGTRLSAALAAAHCAPLADVYAPLSVPPAASMAQADLSVDNAQDFHTSAVLAAFIDAASLPWRLRSAEGLPPSRSALGAMDFSDAAALLSGNGAARPFAAAALSLPGPAVLRPTPGVGTGAAPPLELGSLFSLTPGAGAALEAPLVEAYTLRGLLWDASGAADPAASRAAAQAALRASGVRCVRALCAAAAPLPVPLCYPRIVHRRGAESAPRPPNPDTAPALSRLAAAEDFAPLLRATAADLHRLARIPAGTALLSSWGLATTDVGEAVESLNTLATAYSQGSDDGDDDDRDDS